MRLGIDLDGVCADFCHDSRIVCANLLGVPPESLPEVEVWDFPTEQWGIESMDVFWDAWFKAVKDGWAWWKSRVFPGTVEGLTALRDTGHSIHIITSRKGGELATSSWIQENDIPYDSLHIGRDKTIINFDLLLDDWERNWVEVTEAGGRCVLFDRPWNRHLEDAERVHTWDEFVELVGSA